MEVATTAMPAAAAGAASAAKRKQITPRNVKETVSSAVGAGKSSHSRDTVRITSAARRAAQRAGERATEVKARNVQTMANQTKITLTNKQRKAGITEAEVRAKLFRTEPVVVDPASMRKTTTDRKGRTKTVPYTRTGRQNNKELNSREKRKDKRKEERRPEVVSKRKCIYCGGMDCMRWPTRCPDCSLAAVVVTGPSRALEGTLSCYRRNCRYSQESGYVYRWHPRIIPATPPPPPGTPDSMQGEHGSEAHVNAKPASKRTAKRRRLRRRKREAARIGAIVNDPEAVDEVPVTQPPPEIENVPVETTPAQPRVETRAMVSISTQTETLERNEMGTQTGPPPRPPPPTPEALARCTSPPTTSVKTVLDHPLGRSALRLEFDRIFDDVDAFSAEDMQGTKAKTLGPAEDKEPEQPKDEDDESKPDGGSRPKSEVEDDPKKEGDDDPKKPDDSGKPGDDDDEVEVAIDALALVQPPRGMRVLPFQPPSIRERYAQRREIEIVDAELLAFMRRKAAYLPRTGELQQRLKSYGEEWLKKNRPGTTETDALNMLIKAVRVAMVPTYDEEEARQFIKNRHNLRAMHKASAAAKGDLGRRWSFFGRKKVGLDPVDVASH